MKFFFFFFFCWKLSSFWTGFRLLNRSVISSWCTHREGHHDVCCKVRPRWHTGSWLEYRQWGFDRKPVYYQAARCHMFSVRGWCIGHIAWCIFYLSMTQTHQCSLISCLLDNDVSFYLCIFTILLPWSVFPLPSDFILAVVDREDTSEKTSSHMLVCRGDIFPGLPSETCCVWGFPYKQSMGFPH